MSDPAQARVTVVDLGNQPNGFYIIRVKNGAATATETVIVQH